MPKLLHKLPKYRRHSSRDSAFVVIEGRRTYLPGGFNSEQSKAEYRRLCAEWVARDRPTTPKPSMAVITVVEVCASFWRYAEVHYVKNGVPTDELACIRMALRPLNELYGATEASAFGPSKLKAVRERMIADGLARPTINECMAKIRRVFRWAASEELLLASVWQSLATVQGLQRGRTEAREPDLVLPVADDVVAATIPYLTRIVADMVRLQQLSGARPGEVVVLRPGDIDMTGKIWKYSPSGHKMEHRGRGRVIYFGPQAQAILRPYLDREPTAYCFSPREAEEERREAAHKARRTPLHYGNAPGTNRLRKPRKAPGERYDADAYRRAISRACELAFKMPSHLRVIDKQDVDADERRTAAAEWRAAHVWSPNQLRHSAATKIRAEFGLEAAQATLGHSTADTTLIYAERSEGVALAVAEKMG
ncbi:MAG: site-specific integrase [Pirellulales bacterium]